MIKMYLLLTIISICTSFSSAAPQPSTTITVFDKFGGIWAYKNINQKFDCSEAVHTISFNQKKKEAYFDWVETDKNPPQRSTYTILKHTDKVIRMQEHGEMRKDNEGNLVIWDLIKVSNGEYTWHRKDWPSNGSTGYFKKCHKK